MEGVWLGIVQEYRSLSNAEGEGGRGGTSGGIVISKSFARAFNKILMLI